MHKCINSPGSIKLSLKNANSETPMGKAITEPKKITKSATVLEMNLRSKHGKNRSPLCKLNFFLCLCVYHSDLERAGIF